MPVNRGPFPIVPSNRVPAWRLAMAGQGRSPAEAGRRFVAIEVMRFVFIMCLVAGDGFEPPTSGL